MFTVCIVVILLLFIINFILRKSLINEGSFILAFWIISVIVNRAGTIEYYDINDKTYAVIIVGLTMYMVGNWCQTLSFAFRKKEKNAKNSVINWQILYLFLCLHIFTTVYFCITMFKMLSDEYTFLQIREIYQGYKPGVSFTNGQFERVLLHWVAQPLAILLMVITIVLIIRKDYTHKRFLVWVVLDEIAYFIYTQSRAGVFYIAIYLIVIYINQREHISAKLRKKIQLVVFFIFLGITLWTIAKFAGSQKWNGLKTYELYLGGGISLLNYGIERVDSRNIQTYGMNFIYGAYIIVSNIYYVFSSYKSPFNSMLVANQAVKENFVRIGTQVWFNAYYTFLYDFYMDGGLLFVGLESLLFGIISARSILKMRTFKNNTELQCRGLLMCIVIFMGIIRWQFVSPTFAFMYIYMYFVFHFPITLKICHKK